MSIIKDIQKRRQLDELSKGTLKSYASKASKSADTHDEISGMYHKAAKKQHDGMDQLHLKHMWKAENRRQNVDKAKKKIGEEVEQIDELSKDTVKSYFRKASQDKENIDGERKMEWHSNGGSAKKDGTFAGKTQKWKELSRKGSQRKKGIDMAVKKLSEETEKSPLREEIESLIAEGTVKAANKVKKNLHALKIGHSKSTEALIDKTSTGRHGELTGAVVHKIKRDQSGQSKRHFDQQTAARWKKDGRKHLRGEFLHQKDKSS